MLPHQIQGIFYYCSSWVPGGWKVVFESLRLDICRGCNFLYQGEKLPLVMNMINQMRGELLYEMEKASGSVYGHRMGRFNPPPPPRRSRGGRGAEESWCYSAGFLILSMQFHHIFKTIFVDLIGKHFLLVEVLFGFFTLMASWEGPMMVSLAAEVVGLLSKAEEHWRVLFSDCNVT